MVTSESPKEALLLTGLGSVEARERLDREGPNALPEPPPKSLTIRFLRQFRSALSLLLLVAVVLDFGLWLIHGASGTPIEPVAILAVLLLNASLGLLQERRSERALADLKALGAPASWVKRDGELKRVPAEQLVRGDVVRIEAGDRVPADGILREQASLALDEAILTGESLPAEKEAGEGVWSGTLAVRGSAFFQVTETGPRSSIGRLADRLSTIQTSRTPLERRLDVFGGQIAVVVGALAALMVIVGLLSEGWDRLGALVTFAVAFAVAVVPEGMPAVLTLALAIGVQRMARRNAVVRRLSSVEALGSVTVIATDKTGTLTQNQMSVAAVYTASPKDLAEAVALANDAEPDSPAGDPLDRALLEYAQSCGVDVVSLRERLPRSSVRPFDSAWKFMRVTVRAGNSEVSYLKGAVETLLDRVQLPASQSSEPKSWSEQEASAGRRVIAVARAEGERETELTLVGLISVWDPPRQGAPAAVRAAQAAGVRVMMVTGDHPLTARAIAENVGFSSTKAITGEALRAESSKRRMEIVQEVDIVARATPEDKLFIVEALQRGGQIVAMTGDGVNDAPALKRADVGVSMGRRGSDVAREVSDLVLLDDDFSTIVTAIDEGRNIYENIQKFIRFTFSTNVALAILVLGGALGSYIFHIRDDSGTLVVPLTAIQILFINFIGDGPPALALAIDRNRGTMSRAPRTPGSRLLDSTAMRFIATVGLLEGAIGLVLLLVIPQLGMGLVETRTAVFLYEAAAKLVSVYPARRLSGQPTRNRPLHAAIAFGLVLIAGCVYCEPLAIVLGLVPLSNRLLLALAAAVLLTWALGSLAVRIQDRRASDAES